MRQTNYTIDINKSKVAIINDLLRLEGKKHNSDPVFKKTAKSFKKKYGFDLNGAPVVFKSNGLIYKLTYIVSNYSSHLGGRKFEIADYQPVVSVGKYFDRLSLSK